ncbi:MAG: hypothetical protein ABI559_06865, partial [Chloroflexota bacterium]
LRPMASRSGSPAVFKQEPVVRVRSITEDIGTIQKRPATKIGRDSRGKLPDSSGLGINSTQLEQ